MAEQRKQALGDFLVSAPLYTQVVLTDLRRPGDGLINMPRRITRYCGNEKCRAELQWFHDTPGGYGEQSHPGSIQSATYKCPNCSAEFRAWYFWTVVDGKIAAMKVGQLPQLEVPLAKDLEKALGKHADLWKKGMRSRHHGYGIGALAYFRRIVEGATGNLLNLLANAMQAAGEEPTAVEAVRALITAKAPFDKKMEQAARMIPRTLRPGGANPFQTMFDVVSGGLHGDTDEECCELVDALSQSIVLIVGQLNEHIEARKAYGDAVANVERLRARRTE